MGMVFEIRMQGLSCNNASQRRRTGTDLFRFALEMEIFGLKGARALITASGLSQIYFNAPIPTQRYRSEQLGRNVLLSGGAVW